MLSAVYAVGMCPYVCLSVCVCVCVCLSHSSIVLQEALLLQRDRATRLSVQILQQHYKLRALSNLCLNISQLNHSLYMRVEINGRFWTTSASGLGHVTVAILGKEYLTPTAISKKLLNFSPRFSGIFCS